MTAASVFIINPFLSCRRSGVLTLRRPEPFKVPAGGLVTWIEGDGLVVIVEAAAQVPFEAPGEAAIVEKKK